MVLGAAERTWSLLLWDPDPRELETTPRQRLVLRLKLMVLILWQFFTALFRRRPNLLLCSHEKCGTSTLAKHLCACDSIAAPRMAFVKEETYYAMLYDKLPFFWLGFELGYRAHGPLLFPRHKYVLDACQSGSFFPALTSRLNPVGTKFLLLLRDPVERAQSAFNSHTREQKVGAAYAGKTFEEACDIFLARDEKLCAADAAIRSSTTISSAELEAFIASGAGFFEVGKYDVTLSAILAKHPRENVFVSHMAHLTDDAQALVDTCCAFLGVKACTVETGYRRNTAPKSADTISDQLRRRLQRHFRPSMDRANAILSTIATYPPNLQLSF